MIRASLLLIAIVALFPLRTSPTMAAARTEPSPEAVRNEAAMALIEIPWQQLKYDIVFLPARRGFRAMTFSQEHKIEIYARPDDDSLRLARTIAHELGHAIDLTYNTTKSRKKWKQLRGIDASTPWFGCNRCSDHNTPAGDFAETFALLLFGPDGFSARIAPPPTADQIPELAAFFPKGFIPAEGR
jgi:hypothetical protein